MPSLGPFIGFGNGTLLFLTFAAVGVGFNLGLDTVMRRPAIAAPWRVD